MIRAKTESLSFGSLLAEENCGYRISPRYVFFSRLDFGNWCSSNYLDAFCLDVDL